MKKTLMVLSFALCATFVFAQTANLHTPQVTKASNSAAPAQTDLSKALFTKDATPLLTVDFHDGTAGQGSSANFFTGTGYQTGVVVGGTEAHGEEYDFAYWRRVPNVETSTLQGLASIYTYLSQAWATNFPTSIFNMADSSTSSSENGFMMMTMYDQRTDQSGNFNAYIAFDAVDASNAAVLDIQFFQRYRKYYDFCYVDYSTNGSSWNEMEINVDGVDLSVNDDLAGFSTYTLPLSLAGQSTVYLRLRWKSLDSHRGSAYGYWWLVDDFSILSCDADRLRFFEQEYVEGNYSLIPQGMKINPAWYGRVLNNGATAQNNITVSLNHLNADQTVNTLISSYNNGNLAAGSQMLPICDPTGWILVDSMDYAGWYGYGFDSPHGTGIDLPTATAGDNYLYASLSSDAFTNNFDTMFYKVTTLDETTKAYRWGHDNGVLTYSPYNYYIFGFVQSNGNWYVTEDVDDVHYYTPGYRVTTRYTTSSAVPEGWVIRGVELVASPSRDFHATGTKISPVLSQDEYDGGSVGFSTVMTGAGVYTVTDDDVNDSTVIGRNSNGYLELGNYNTITMMFPEQPALQPNTSYRAGYVMEEEGYFALASESHGSYRMASPTRPDQYDTILYFRNDPSLAKYAHPFPLCQYQNHIIDEFRPDHNSLFAAWYYDFQPMIHLLVGPAQAVTRVNVSVDCDSSEYGEVYYGGQEACGTTVTPVEASSPVLTLAPFEGCSVRSLYVDGVEVTPYDEITEEGDPNYVAVPDGDGAMRYTFAEIMGDHQVTAVFSELPPIGIDPLAANVRMNLQPNPATSQVSINLEGVTGMVNCAIIDMSGRVVYTNNFNAEDSQVINLNNVAKGAYFVRITNNTFSTVEKLIVR
jgi:hypothetical protein